jgi:hypothetical protein
VTLVGNIPSMRCLHSAVHELCNLTTNFAEQSEGWYLSGGVSERIKSQI